jgi:hypothetical protein
MFSTDAPMSVPDASNSPQLLTAVFNAVTRLATSAPPHGWLEEPKKVEGDDVN